jgi:hypothetical protein
MKASILAHVCGQNEDMGYDGLSVGQVAKMLCVTKPTAIVRLRRLVEQGYFFERKVHWRGHATKLIFTLTDDAKKDYKNNAFRDDYLKYYGIVIDRGDQLTLF